jgi:hypothetical protein
MSELVIDAPIVAVVVYPDRARVTRRGRITAPAGDQTVYIESLPLALQEDSVRVSGRGPATVLGVMWRCGIILRRRTRPWPSSSANAARPRPRSTS